MSGHKQGRADLWDRQQPWVATRFRELLDASDVTDVEPLSMTTVPVEGGNDAGGGKAPSLHVYVVSRSRGRVRIGTVPIGEVKANLGDVAVPYVQELEAALADRTRSATDKRRADTAKNVARARELRAEGLSAARIAVKMTVERGDPQRPPLYRRTIQRWLATRKPTAD